MGRERIELYEAVLAEEHKRLEEIKQLRQIVAILVLQAGGEVAVDVREIIALDPNTELQWDVDGHGNLHLWAGLPETHG